MTAGSLTKLATLTIDTTGFDSIGQSWSFNLAFDVSGVGYAQTDYILAGITLGADFEPGSLTVVPEPNAMWALGPCLAVAALLWRKRKGQ